MGRQPVGVGGRIQETRRWRDGRGNATNPLYPVRLFNNDATRQAEITLPFAPFPGLFIQAPWKGMDYVQITEVFWHREDGEFECYAGAEE